MLLRLVLILTLALQPLAGVASVATDCPSRSRLLSVSPICTTTDEPCCSGEQTVSPCCQIAAEPAEPGCPCSESVCPTILGHECGSCGCHPDRPAQPLTNSASDARAPIFVALGGVDLPPAPAPRLVVQAPFGTARPLSWLGRVSSAGDRRCLLCSLTT